ncbi:deoxynucleotidyltransferase terminal-interacting protein 2 [Leptodactylus fuscus]|uniref:deoxynucleotidyltransferase terminal-interacting protein 2 n=1 Tax=Leptodactylus fuscus TaxID=238119 RepID=UPI003F4F3688
MVATRRSTRVEPQKQGEPTPEEVDPPTSPVHTRRSVKKDVQTSDNSTEESKSIVTSRSPLKSDTVIDSPRITTRSRHRSEKSDTDVSEVESTASNTSTRLTRSRQRVGQVTDSTRKLRRHQSTLITDPIIESKEDAALSEAESDCLSVSTPATKKQPGTASRSVSTRSRRSILLPEPADVSDEESESSVSQVKSVITRNTRSSRNRAQMEETSDAESCCSGVSLEPVARRFSRRNKPNVQIDEIGETNKDDDQENLKKQSPKMQDVKSDAAPSVGEKNVLASPRRQLRNRPAVQEHKAILISDDESRNDGEEKKSVATKEVRTSEKSLLQSSELEPEENLPNQLVQLPEEFMEEEPTVEESHVTDDKDTTENLPNEQENLNVSANINLCLSIDSHDSKESEHGDDDVDEEEDEQVMEKGKSEKASGKQLQNVDGGELFVIDTTPGSSKSCFLEPDDNEDDEDFIDKAEEEEDDENEDDDDDEDFIDKAEEEDDENEDDDDFIDKVEEEEDENDIEVDEEDNEHVVEKQKSKKAPAHKLQNVDTGGLFVIDTTPGMDSSKKYFVDLDDHVSDKEEEATDKGEINEQEEEAEDDVEEEEEDFIDKSEDEDEEETLLKRPRTGFSLSTSIDTGISLKKMGGLYINFDAEKINPGPSLIDKMKKGNKKKDELLKKSVITPDFEKKESVPPYRESYHKLKRLRKEERDKSTGRGWFDMKAPDMTEELKNDLKALKMRSAMDPKHFYKKNDREGFPKYFEVATVVDNPIDFYHSRIPKKDRKRTIVEELIADSKFRRYNKKKYQEIMAEKAARAEGKKNRKKKKFRK